MDALSAYFPVYMTQFKIHNASIIDAEWWNKFVTSIVCKSMSMCDGERREYDTISTTILFEGFSSPSHSHVHISTFNKNVARKD